MSGSLVRNISRNLSTHSKLLKPLDFLSEPDNGNKTSTAPVQQAAISVEPLDFKKYEDRLKSFSNWPNNDVSKELLAKAGFFYKNCNDVVQCPFCHIEGFHWVAGDDPMQDHRSWSPRCPFVMTSVEPDSPNNRNVDTCGLYGVEILPNSVPEDEIRLEKLGIQKNKGPAHPDKFSYESRIKTFTYWPRSIKQTPHVLAEAGFFYVGVGDQTICFHCGGGLKDWESDDNPWEEHALWFPKCPYLFLKKGSEYINEVKQKRDPRRTASTLSPSSSEAKECPKAAQCLSVEKSEISASEEEDPKNEKTLCKICFKNEVGVVFLPCGHIVACVECSVALKTCAVCRKPLEASVRAFLS